MRFFSADDLVVYATCILAATFYSLDMWTALGTTLVVVGVQVYTVAST